MRRAQINQAFIYIAAILVIGAIAVIGAKAILGIFSASCQSKSSEFNSKVVSLLDQNSDRGTVNIESLPAPCDVVEVCFVSASAMTPIFTDPDPVIEESVKEGSYNIFAKGKFTTPIAKYDGLATPADALTCIKVQNDYVKMKLTGQGRLTIVEQG